MKIPDKMPVLNHSKRERKKKKVRRTAETERNNIRAKEHAQKALKNWNMCYGSDNTLNSLKISPRESIREKLHSFNTPAPL